MTAEQFELLVFELREWRTEAMRRLDRMQEDWRHVDARWNRIRDELEEIRLAIASLEK